MDGGYRDIGRSGYRDIGRSGSSYADFGGGYANDFRCHGRTSSGSGGAGSIRGGGGLGYLDLDPFSTRDGLLGTSPGSSGAGLRSSYGRGIASYERDIVDSLLAERNLQELSLRDFPMPLFGSLLHGGQELSLNKRDMDVLIGGGADYLNDFKRPRLNTSPRAGQQQRFPGAQTQRNRNSGGQDNLRNRSNQRSPGGLGQSAQGKGSKEAYNPVKPTGGYAGMKRAQGGQVQALLGCKACGVDFMNMDQLRRHLDSNAHKTRNTVRTGKKHCTICDIDLDGDFTEHHKLLIHRTRQSQVMKGCKLCSFTFKNYTQVVAHLETKRHKKNLKAQEAKANPTPQAKERKPIKVKMPDELKKFDAELTVGQSCVIATSGWFCKACNKFYNNEVTAKETHCKTETHFKNYKQLTYKRLRAKAEQERDAEEKEEEEERKKKEAEKPKGEQAMAEENGGGMKGGEENGVAAKREQGKGQKGDETDEEMDVGEEFEGGVGGEEEEGYGGEENGAA